MKTLFCPSLMCMDLLHIEEQLRILGRHCDMLHADIMDGHFCPNLTLSPLFLKAIRPATALPIDAHLMVEKPWELLEDVAQAGADCISLHAETINTNAFRTLNRVHALGCKAGLVLNPATPVELVEYLLPLVDLLTIMTVDVGYAGQPFIPQMVDKIARAAEIIEKNGYGCTIQTDGACNRNTYARTYAAGARAFVMGSSGLFGQAEDLERACVKMKREFARAVGVEMEP